MSFLVEGARRDKQAPGEVQAGPPTGAIGTAPDGAAPRLRAIPSEDPHGQLSPSTPWAQRRLNEALAELGPVRPQTPPGEASEQPSTLAETAIAAAAALSRHSPLLAQATLSPPSSPPSSPPPLPPQPFVASSPEARSLADAGRAGKSQTSPIALANDASQIVRALALTCDRETLAPMPAQGIRASSAAPLPPPPPVQTRSPVTSQAKETAPVDLVPAWLVVPPSTPLSPLVEGEDGERPPMIIERAIAEAEQAASEAAGSARALHDRAAKPSAWPPLATGFALALATGAVLYAVLVAG